MKTDIKRAILVLSATIACFFGASAQNSAFAPGTIWLDTDSVPINAHGGCIVYEKGNYYWFGEDRTGMKSNGVSCYRSKDLYNWTRVGMAMAVTGEKTDTMNDIAPGRLFERPKVIFNRQLGKYVMWSHWESGDGYGAARVCVATSDRIEGPYALYKTFRPNGHDSRDQTLFLDENGKAYHFCSTDMNTNMNVALLGDDYLEPTQHEVKILKGKKCEAPAIFRKGDMYFGLFSGCTGWDPNAGRTAWTYDLLGEWNYDGTNFAVDKQKELTYRSQSAFVFSVAGNDNAWIYVGDRWNPKNVETSTYVILPVSMRSGYPRVRWYDKWDLSVFDNMYRYKRAARIIEGNVYALLERNSDRIVSKPVNGITLADDDDSINMGLYFIATDSPNVYKLKDAKTGKFLSSAFGSLRLLDESEGDSQKWVFSSCPDGYYRIRNQADKKLLSVSGKSTLNGSSLYLTNKENDAAYFAVYFDSRKYDYEEADIFSHNYIKSISQ